MAQMDAIGGVPWYRSLNREQWRVLIASNLGWLFDGFEIYALFLTVGFALKQLLDVGQAAAIPQYAGYILAFTVFGWATGGVIGGIVADYIGRKRTMLLAILAYSLTTGLSAFAWDWVSFAVLRFLVGVGDRFGMGDRRLYRFRGVAGPRARQRRRAAAGRIRAGQHSRLIGLAGDHVGQSGGLVGDARPQRLALPLSDRRVAGLGGIVDSAKHP